LYEFYRMEPLPFPPPVWPFAPLSALDEEESSYAREKTLGLEMQMRFERTVATNTVARTGGTEIIRANWPAEAILGDKFTGNSSLL
jgi:hypothetical protein